MVATPDVSLLPLARAYGAEVFLGSEHDVLGRYTGCAKAFGFDSVVRVTADCPYLEPSLIRDSVQYADDFDYVSNVIERTYPYGLDFEIVKTEVLKRLDMTMPEGPYREHVTLYIREHLSEFKTKSIVGSESYTQYDWRLDRRDDLPYLRALYKCGTNVLYPFSDMIKFHSYAEHLRAFAVDGDSSRRPPAANGGDSPKPADSAHSGTGVAWYERGYRVEGAGP